MKLIKVVPPFKKKKQVSSEHNQKTKVKLPNFDETRGRPCSKTSRKTKKKIIFLMKKRKCKWGMTTTHRQKARDLLARNKWAYLLLCIRADSCRPMRSCWTCIWNAVPRTGGTKDCGSCKSESLWQRCDSIDSPRIRLRWLPHLPPVHRRCD